MGAFSISANPGSIFLTEGVVVQTEVQPIHTEDGGGGVQTEDGSNLLIDGWP